MFKEQSVMLYRLALALDSLVIAAAFCLAFLLRVALPHIWPGELAALRDMPPFMDYARLIFFAVPLWIVSLMHFKVYHSMREQRVSELFWKIFDASLLSILVFSAVAFLLKFDILSRTFVLLFFVLTVLLLLAEKVAVLAFLQYIRKQGYNYRVFLIVGTGERARDFAAMVREKSHWGIRILGFIDEPGMVGKEIGSSRVIGSFDDLGQILDEQVVDEVVFILPRRWIDRLEDYVETCERVGVKATIAADFFNTAIAKPVIRELQGKPFLTFDATPTNLLHLSIKRMLDIAGSLYCLFLLSPFFCGIALIIKATSPGPVFFRQKRCGLNGREFGIYKFRTMVVDAEERLEELKAFNERGGPVFKMKHDPRITWIGRFLRKTSLDELPQLINVLRGDMSLIGPRPPLPSEVAGYKRWQRRRLSLKPGMACIHEVVARDDKDFERWMKMDLEYIDNWSLSLDAKILRRAILVVFRGTGC